jgi:hypothetical protein
MVNLVTDPEVNVGSNYQKFDDAGRLTDDGNRASLEKLMAALRAAV